MRTVKQRATVWSVFALSTLFVVFAIHVRNEYRADGLREAQKRHPPVRVTVERPPEPEFVVARDGKLSLHGKPYRFLGANVYSLAAYPHGRGRFACGRGFTDDGVDRIMKELADMGMNAVRVPAYQSFLRDPKDPRKLRFDRFDRIVAAAKRNGIRLIIPFESQWWHCTKSGYKWSDWYASGHKRPYGGYRISYRDFVLRVVTRYKDEPTVLMWQLVNEAESRDRSMLDEPEPLHRFVREMAAAVKQADPDHLLSPGATDMRAPGSGGPFYPLLHRIPGIDAVEAHDYDHDDVAVPKDIRAALWTAQRLRKPFYLGEVGVKYRDGRTRAERANLLMRKVRAVWDSGAQGVLIWSYRAGDGRGYDFWPKDPLVAKLRAFSKEKRLRDAN